MDHHCPLEHEVRVDVESANEEEVQVFTKSCDHFMSLNDHLSKLGVDPSTANVGSHENSFTVSIDVKLAGAKSAGDFIGKEKRKKASSAKKPPKPPRPHSGFSLDSADQKLIKELAELAMIKRARIERMKALMQKKASKASSSSNGSLFAMIFTIIFFLVLLFQGMSCQNPHRTFKGSPQTSQTNENGLIFIERQLNPSSYGSI